jgi:hypothetical protein
MGRQLEPICNLRETLRNGGTSRKLESPVKSSAVVHGLGHIMRYSCVSYETLGPHAAAVND